MAVLIASIKDANLRVVAQMADQNRDGKLKKEEYSVFAQIANSQGYDKKSIQKALDMNNFLACGLM